MNILITGAGGGIGFALCEVLSSDPKNLVFAVTSDLKRLGALRDRNNVIGLEADLLKADTIPMLKQKVSEHTSCLDVLINNAGMLKKADIMEMSLADWGHIYRVNVLTAVEMCKGFKEMLSRSVDPQVLNIGSMSGYQDSRKFPGLGAYSASKAALAAFSQVLAEEWRADGIRVNCLCPGSVGTKMFEDAFPGNKAAASAFDLALFIKGFIESGKMINAKVLALSSDTP